MGQTPLPLRIILETLEASQFGSVLSSYLDFDRRVQTCSIVLMHNLPEVDITFAELGNNANNVGRRTTAV